MKKSFQLNAAKEFVNVFLNSSVFVEMGTKVCGLSLHLGSSESRKTLEQKFTFQIGTLKEASKTIKHPLVKLNCIILRLSTTWAKLKGALSCSGSSKSSKAERFRFVFYDEFLEYKRQACLHWFSPAKTRNANRMNLSCRFMLLIIWMKKLFSFDWLR